MNGTSMQRGPGALSRLRLFLGLSRTPHALLDMATPGLAALLWLGAFPPPKVILLGLMTVFSGYTSVYALNDLLDHRADRTKIKGRETRDSRHDLDALIVRHPIAQGLVSIREGLSWTGAWATLALVGAYVLNPVCAIIFLAGCGLEAIYCFLGRVSHLRVILSGAVKTSGAMAAVFAVDPHPSWSFLLVLFLWFFFWEIGGQNIPNDWGDLDEDNRLRDKSIPLQFGPERANAVVMGSLLVVVALSLLVLSLAPLGFEWPFSLIALFVGAAFLLLPAYRLHKSKDPLDALALFNRASYYPLALLLAVGTGLILR